MQNYTLKMAKEQPPLGPLSHFQQILKANP